MMYTCKHQSTQFNAAFAIHHYHGQREEQTEKEKKRKAAALPSPRPDQSLPSSTAVASAAQPRFKVAPCSSRRRS
jgi:hypothetical protein